MRKKLNNYGGTENENEQESEIKSDDEFSDYSIDFNKLISELNYKLINLKGNNTVNFNKKTKITNDEYIERIDRNDKLNPNVEKMIDNANETRKDIYYIDNILPNDKKQRKICLDAIKEYNTELVKDFNTVIEEYKIELNKNISKTISYYNKQDKQDKQDKIFENILKFYNTYFNDVESIKSHYINIYISSLKKNYPIFELLIKSYKSIKIDKDIEINKEGGSNSLKYKNIQKPQYTIDKACQEYKKSKKTDPNKRTFYDYIASNHDERLRKDAELNTDIFSEIVDGDLVNSEVIRYKKIEIDLLTGQESKTDIYERQFISQNYNKELIYYIESVLIDNNELIEIFTDSHTKYLKTLNICERYTVNDYTTRLFDYYNLWKTNQDDLRFVDLKYKLSNGIVPTELKNYLNSQIWKVLIYRKIIDPSVVVDFETNNLLKNNLEDVNNYLDEIFKLYELELNKIIIDAPPRLFAFTCFRGSKENYIQELPESEVEDESSVKTYFKSTRFSSYTIDIFNNIVSNFTGNLETSRIYETLVSPTAKVLYVAPLSSFNNELEIFQSNDQIIDPLFNKEQFDIYSFNNNNFFDDADLLCNSSLPNNKSVKHIKEIFLI